MKPLKVVILSAGLCIVSACGQVRATDLSQESDNLIPPGYVDPYITRFHFEEKNNEKLAKYQDLPDGRGEDNVKNFLQNVPDSRQNNCLNWCGPSAVQNVLGYFNKNIELARVAQNVGNTSCHKPGDTRRYNGTCLTQMYRYLADTVTSNEDYVPAHLNSSTPEAAAADLWTRVRADVDEYKMPIIALLVPNSENRERATLTGWQRSLSTGHFITIYGYEQTELSESGSSRGDRQRIYYRDSMGRNIRGWDPVDVVAETIRVKDGQGSCSGSKRYNLIW